MNATLMYDANDNRQNNPFCSQQIRYRDYKILGTSVINRLKSTPSWLLLREKINNIFVKLSHPLFYMYSSEEKDILKPNQC